MRFKLLFLFLILFSSSVFADSYPALPTIGTDYCTAGGYIYLAGNNTCANAAHTFTFNVPSYSCPGGGTLSGSLCTGVDSCPDGTVRSSSTGKCPPPPPPPPLPQCSTLLCTSVDQQCSSGDGTTAIKSACPLPPPPDDHGCPPEHPWDGTVCKIYNTACGLATCPDTGTGGTGTGGTGTGGTGSGGTGSGGTGSGGTGSGGTGSGGTGTGDTGSGGTGTGGTGSGGTGSGGTGSGGTGSGGTGSGGTGTGGTGSGGIGTGGTGGTTCPAYYHADGFGGCSNGDCPAGQFRDTVLGSACQMIPTALDTSTLAKDATLVTVKNSTDAVKASIDSEKTSVDAVKTSVDASKSSIDAVKSSVDGVKTSVDALKISVDASKTSIDAVKSSVDASKTAINDVKGSVDGVKGGIDGLGSKLSDLMSGTANGVQVSTGNTQFDDSMPNAQVTQAKSDYQAKFNEVKTALHSMFQLSVGAVGQLPSFDFGTIKGVHVVVDLNRYAGQLSYVGLTILFAAAFIALMIFLG